MLYPYEGSALRTMLYPYEGSALRMVLYPCEGSALRTMLGKAHPPARSIQAAVTNTMHRAAYKQDLTALQAGKCRMEAPADLASGESSLLGLQTLTPSPGRRGRSPACVTHLPVLVGVPADGLHQLLMPEGLRPPPPRLRSDTPEPSLFLPKTVSACPGQVPPICCGPV